MAYRVEFAARAARDLEILYVEKNAAESQAAAGWYSGLEEAVYALETHPNRCPVAPEARKLKRKLRHLLYGKKPHIYRVIYEVEEQRRTVWLLTIRHGARRRMRTSDLAIAEAT
jgi:toxin ParE1/3/4